MNTSILRCLGALAIIMVTSPRSVDAAAPDGHYVITAGSGAGNGTVYDSKSKLTWQQTVSSAKYSWTEAKSYCAGVGATLGGTGWRVPTIKELLSIVDFSQGGPAVDRNAFPSTPSGEFWSSSPKAHSSSYAWLVHFGSGGDVYDGSVSSTFSVRCVR